MNKITNKNFKDITGQKFGRLTVIKISHKNKQRKYKWLCKCECGNFLKVWGGNLKNGHTKSCGCLQQENRGQANITHGMRKTLEYNVWATMKDRCFNKNAPNYKIYGKRGITICKRWEKFENFFTDMGKRPKGMSIDRINNNGNYEPENCQWATQKEQCRNTRKNRMLTFQGKTLCMAEWAERLGINYKCLWKRLNTGWSVERAFVK